MKTDEIAMHITMKAMETGYIIRKDLNQCTTDDRPTELTKSAVDQVSAFYKGIKQCLEAE